MRQSDYKPDRISIMDPKLWSDSEYHCPNCGKRMRKKENLRAREAEFRFIHCCPDWDWIGFRPPNLDKKDS